MTETNLYCHNHDIVEALQWDGKNEEDVIAMVRGASYGNRGDDWLVLNLDSNNKRCDDNFIDVHLKDWVMIGVDNKIQTCKPVIFDAMFSKVDKK